MVPATATECEILTDDKETPPLLPACAPGFLCGTLYLDIGFDNVVIDFFSFLLDVLDHRLLLHDDRIKILEELS